MICVYVGWGGSIFTTVTAANTGQMVSAIKQRRTGIRRFAASKQSHGTPDEAHRSTRSALRRPVGRRRRIAAPLAGRPACEQPFEETAARQCQRQFGRAGAGGVRGVINRMRKSCGHHGLYNAAVRGRLRQRLLLLCRPADDATDAQMLQYLLQLIVGNVSAGRVAATGAFVAEIARWRRRRQRCGHFNLIAGVREGRSGSIACG